MNIEERKRQAACSAAKLIKDGDVVGLGTGSTVYYLILEISKMLKRGLDIICIPTSIATKLLAIEHGIKVSSLDECSEIDIAIDGADQIDERLNLIKGGGGAHTREKIIASCAKRFIAIADSTKYSKTLNMPIPIEVLPFARAFVEKRLLSLGGKPKIRIAKKKVGPVITDNGNLILDVNFGEIENPAELEREINSIPGVIENGIFSGMVNEVHLGTKNGVKILKPG